MPDVTEAQAVESVREYFSAPGYVRANETAAKAEEKPAKAAPAKEAAPKAEAEAKPIPSDPEEPHPDTAKNPDGEPAKQEPEGTDDEAKKPEAEGEEPEAKEIEADSEEATEAAEPTKLFNVPMPDGTTQKVTFKEMREGYLRQSDYSRKSNEFSAEKESFARESEQIRQRQLAVLEATEQRFQQLDPVAILKGQLKQAQEMGDTEEVLRLRLDIQETERVVEQNRRAAEWERHQNEQQKQQELTQKQTRERELLRQKVPELATKEGKDKFLTLANKALEKSGFSKDEIAEMSQLDHRWAIIAHGYGKYLTQLEQRPKIAEAIQGKAVTLKQPGARQSDAKGTAMAEATRQFNKNPNAEGSLAGFFKAL